MNTIDAFKVNYLTRRISPIKVESLSRDGTRYTAWIKVDGKDVHNTARSRGGWKVCHTLRGAQHSLHRFLLKEIDVATSIVAQEQARLDRAHADLKLLNSQIAKEA